MLPSALRRRVLLSGTMLVAATVGYGRRAYGACVNSGGPNYLCSGADVTTQISIQMPTTPTSPPSPGSASTRPPDAITINGDGALSYIDTNTSGLTATAGNALNVFSISDDGATPGSITIATNGALSGTRGIRALNYGSGAVTVTANGDVTSTGSGILARNLNSGTDLSVTTGAGTTVSAGTIGIYTRNFGTGALTITANGNVTGTTQYGIYARSINGTDLTVTTGATVSGGIGILARNYGTGALTITANGDVTGTAGSAIFAQNLNVNSTALSVTTAAGTTVSGFSGIFAGHYGTGALTIAANGNVDGTTGNGIYARNSSAGTALSVTTGAGTTGVSGSSNGINARNYGTGALTITANGDVTGTTGRGIYAQNLNVTGGANVTVTTAAGTAVSGTTGIFALNFGTGALTVTANGDVTGTAVFGIAAQNINANSTTVSVTTATGIDSERQYIRDLFAQRWHGRAHYYRQRHCDRQYRLRHLCCYRRDGYGRRDRDRERRGRRRHPVQPGGRLRRPPRTGERRHHQRQRGRRPRHRHAGPERHRFGQLQCRPAPPRSRLAKRPAAAAGRSPAPTPASRILGRRRHACC